MRLAAGAATDAGRVRDHNEDSYLLDDERSLFAVADGVGGHRGGEVASSTALEALRAGVASGTALHEAAQSANSAVYDLAATDEALRGMGTTLTALTTIGGSTALLAHVGDSRAYRLRDGAIERLTEDHSLVEELVREGRLTSEQADSHPQRNYITRALGLEPDVEVDIVSVALHAGDRILLCSDGLTTMVRERDIERISRNETDPARAAELLIDAACDAGGEDNVTAVVIDFLEVDGAEAPDPEALAETSPPTTPLPVSEPDIGPPTSAPTITVTRRRLRSFLLLVLPLILFVGLAFTTVAWYARRTYYVGLSGDRVALYRGVPGGLLIWDPTVETISDIDLRDLDPADQAAVADGVAEGSRDRAESYLATLEERATAATSTTSTTTTTRPPRRTTTTTRPPKKTTTTTAGGTARTSPATITGGP
ncbi:MAG: Stp1/IreP family PP2C-type Ser/Thr phosphatase [Acidimicrobiia bacterium]|nr:Stp1/IreP family PP2C-type Ser/Thr phosphatase [Acidimicrobiia bacterium]